MPPRHPQFPFLGFHHALENFLSYLQASRSRSKNTCRNAKAILTRFITYLKDQNIQDVAHITVPVVLTFLKPFQSASYRFNVLYYLRQFLDFLEHPQNPARQIKSPRINPTAAVKFIERDELISLIHLLRQEVKNGNYLREHAIILLMLFTGLRSNEVLQLKKVDLSPSGVLVVRDSKTYETRIAYAPQTVLDAIHVFHQAHPYPDNPFVFYPSRKKSDSHQALSYSALRTSVKKLFIQAGITEKNKSIHALRHTFARSLVEGGFHREEIQKLLGHKSIKTTEIYTRLSDQDILAKAPLVHECVKKYLGEWSNFNE